MPGSVAVGSTPTRPQGRIRLSGFDKRRYRNQQPKFRPVGDDRLRGRERQLDDILRSAFDALPVSLAVAWAAGRATAEDYLAGVVGTLSLYQGDIARVLQEQYNDSAIAGGAQAVEAINQHLARLGSPVRIEHRVEKAAVAKVTVDVMADPTVNVKTGTWGVPVESFNQVNAASTMWAQNESAKLVTNMAGTQQAAVRQAIASSYTEAQVFSTGRAVVGRTTQQTAQTLAGVLAGTEATSATGRTLAEFRAGMANGLTVRYETAVKNRMVSVWNGLHRQGVTGDPAMKIIAKKTKAYADKLRRVRARAIARTEINMAANQGQLASMYKAADDGLIDFAQSGKQWVTGPMDVCAQCEGLAGSIIAINDSFVGVGDAPPAHSNCRCMIRLVPQGGEVPWPVGGGDPLYPMGTRENPMLWQFPKGFQTAPPQLAPQSFAPPYMRPAPAPGGPLPVRPPPTFPPEPAPFGPPTTPGEVRATPQPRHGSRMVSSIDDAIERQAAATGVDDGLLQQWRSVDTNAPSAIPSGSTGVDAIGLDIRAAQGFDEAADIVSHAQIDDIVRAGGKEIWRGEAHVEFAEELLHGRYHPGGGMFGQGTYTDSVAGRLHQQRGMIEQLTAAGRPIDPYTKALADVLETVQGYGTGEKQGMGRVVRMVLKPDAKIVPEEALSAIGRAVEAHAEWIDDLTRGSFGRISQIIDDAVQAGAGDDGFAAAKQAMKQAIDDLTEGLADEAAGGRTAGMGPGREYAKARKQLEGLKAGEATGELTFGTADDLSAAARNFTDDAERLLPKGNDPYGISERAKRAIDEIDDWTENLQGAYDDAMRKLTFPTDGSIPTVARDAGHLAAALGVDGYYARGMSYLVVENRGALAMVQRTFTEAEVAVLKQVVANMSGELLPPHVGVETFRTGLTLRDVIASIVDGSAEALQIAVHGDGAVMVVSGNTGHASAVIREAAISLRDVLAAMPVAAG